MSTLIARMSCRLLPTVLAILFAAGCGQTHGIQAADEEARKRAGTKLADIQPVPRLPNEPSAPTTQAQPDPDADRYTRTGRDHFDHRRWSEAIEVFEKALEINPKSAEVRILLARAALRLDNTELAGEQLAEALKQCPRDVAVYQLLGEAASRSEQTDEAIRLLRLAVMAGRNQPERPETLLAHRALAVLLRRQGYLTAAADELEVWLAATARPTPEMNQYAELKELMELDRGKAAAMLGDIQAELGHHAKALEAYRRAVAEKPDDPPFRAGLATSLALCGRGNEAIDAARELAKTCPEPAYGLGVLKRVCVLLKLRDRLESELVQMSRDPGNPALQVAAAHMLADNGKPAEAIESLRLYVGEHPVGVEGLCLLARLYRERGNLQESLDLLLELLRQQPSAYKQVDAAITEKTAAATLRQLAELAGRARDRRLDDAAARYVNGRLLVLTGQTDAAMDEFRAAARLDRKFGAAYAAMAQLLVARKKWPEVIRVADAAIESGAQDADVYLAKGRAHDALDEADDAEAAWLEAFARNRKSADALLLLAESMERRGRRDRCEQLYRQILDDVDPRCILAREKLFLLYLNSDRIEQARECYAAFAKWGTADATVERCRAMLNLATSQLPDGNQRRAVYQDELRKIAADFPNDAATRIALAMSSFAVGDFAQALAGVDQALEMDPDNLRAREMKVTLEANLLRFAEASAVVEGLLEDRPRDAGYQQQLFELATVQADYDTAVRILREILARDDLGERRKLATAELIEALLDAKRFDEAVDMARDWLAQEPDETGRRDAWLITLTRAGRTDEAIEAIRGWLAADPTNTLLRARYIAQLQEASRNAEAQQQVLSWLANDPDDVDLNRLLVSLLWSAKEWDAAVEVAQTGAELPEHRPAYEALLGQTFVLAGRYDDAVDLYRERANTISTESAYGDFLNVLIRAERIEEAEQLAGKLLIVAGELMHRDNSRQADPTMMVNIRRQLARLYQLTDRPEQAAQQMQAILELTPGDAGTCNDLGYTWADAGMRIEDAERLIRYAVAKSPQQASFLDSLGWVLYKRGNFKDAAYYLRLAIRKSTDDDAVVFDHLGDTLYRGGSPDEARQCWEKALGLTSPDRSPHPDAEQRRLREKIKVKLEQAANGREVATSPLVSPTSAAASTQPVGAKPREKERKPADGKERPGPRSP